jgi:hypothetical protein
MAAMALLSPLGRAGIAFIGIIILATIFGAQQQSIGAAKVVAKIERADNVKAGKIREAGDRADNAAPGRLRGVVRDPNAVTE